MTKNHDHDGAVSAIRRAKLFQHGHSQAVRLPKEFHFEGDEVAIRREGESVILAPLRGRGWPDGYWERIDELRDGLDFSDVEPLGGGLLDLDPEEE
ncbi:hypothetical protein BH20GEM2_BH20GEM2_14610 [soil metagenome]|jgi:antitoxin VapB